MFQDDLTKKSQSLKDQRKLLGSGPANGGVRSYLNCQIFMVAKHQRRLEGFHKEVQDRMASLSLADGSSSPMMMQLLADLAKMKRRCKHILDVTDRFCVLTDQDLKIDTSDVRSRSVEDLSSTDSVDSDTFPTLETSASSSSTSPVPNVSTTTSPITQNIVKSTFESFGSHLAVIAKTYTRKRGHSQEFCSDQQQQHQALSPTPSTPVTSSSSSSSPTDSNSKLGLLTKQKSCTSVGV